MHLSLGVFSRLAHKVIVCLRYTSMAWWLYYCFLIHLFRRSSIINSFLIYLSICLLIYHPIYDLSIHSSSLVDLSIHSLLFTSVCEEARPIFEMGLSL